MRAEGAATYRMLCTQWGFIDIVFQQPITAPMRIPLNRALRSPPQPAR